MRSARSEWDQDAGVRDEPGLSVRNEWDHDEGLDAPPDYASDSGSDTDPEDELVVFMVELLQDRKLLPLDFTTIMWWVAKLKSPERLKPYGFRPNAPSGHAQRHLNSVFGTIGHKLYNMHVPAYIPNRLGRTTVDLHVLPAHEYFADLFSEDVEGASARVRLKEAVEERCLPPAYFSHPIVLQHSTVDQPVQPLSIFIDGLPYSPNDSVTGFWFQDVITGHRCLSALVRKRRMCRCGCRGWCTLFHIFQVLA